MITFTVYGKAETKGSTKSFISATTRQIVTKNDNPRARGWARQIAIEANLAMRGHEPLTDAVALVVSTRASLISTSSCAARRRRRPTTHGPLGRSGTVTRETWRVVPWFEDYEVSTVGRVRRAVRSTNGSPAGRVLKPWLGFGGQAFIALRKDGETHHVRVAQLQDWAFPSRRRAS